MKKILLLLSACFLITSLNTVSAQEVFDKGTNVINVGVAVGHYYGFIPGVGVEYDHAIVDGMINGNASIGIGGYVGLGLYSRYSEVRAYTNAGFRGTFHYQFIDDLDTYAGAIVGGRFGGHFGFNFHPSPFVGARYYFKENLAVFGEVGSGVGYLNVGVSFRF